MQIKAIVFEVLLTLCFALTASGAAHACGAPVGAAMCIAGAAFAYGATRVNKIV